MKINSKLKQQQGSITVFVLLSIMFFVIVLMGLFINSSNKVQKQEKEIQKIQKSYNSENISDLYNKAYKE